MCQSALARRRCSKSMAHFMRSLHVMAVYTSIVQDRSFRSNLSTMSEHPALARAAGFCEAFNLRAPILMAPMGSASPASLAIAVANAGGLGGCGAVRMEPDAIRAWASHVRAGSNGAFQMNLWIPDPPPKHDTVAENAVRNFLANWAQRSPPKPGISHSQTLLPNVRPCWMRDRQSYPRLWGFIPTTS
jgi:hypothetical protein